MKSKAPSHELEDELSEVIDETSSQSDGSIESSFYESSRPDKSSSPQNDQHNLSDGAVKQLQKDKQNLIKRLKRKEGQVRKLKDQIRKKGDETDVAFRKKSSKQIMQLQKKIDSLEGIMKQKEDRIKMLEKPLESHPMSTNSSNYAKQKLSDHNVLKESRILELEKEVSSLRDKLLTCEDELFRLLPVPQSTDSEIQSQYNKLCQQIVTWVEEEVDEFERGHPNSTPYEKTIRAGGDSYIRSVLERVPEAGEYLLGATIHKVIMGRFFGPNIVLFGLNDEMTMLIRDIEEKMEASNLKRDPATIRAWRSDTLQAMIKLPQIMKEREQALQDFTEDLFRSLRAVFPPLSIDGKHRLQLEVTRPAASLEANIHFAIPNYKMQHLQGGLQNSLAVDEEQFRRHVWVDVETRRILKGDRKVDVDGDGNVGMVLLQLESGLVRVGQEGKDIMLYPMKFLLQLAKPLPRQQMKEE